MSLYPFKAVKTKAVRKPRKVKERSLLPYSAIIEEGRVLVTLPLEICNEANNFEHWKAKMGRHRKQKEIVQRHLQLVKAHVHLPCTIAITRIAPNSLDKYDNINYSCKWTLDAICDFLVPGLRPGRADADPRILNVTHHQEKGGVNEYGARIEFIMEKNE